MESSRLRFVNLDRSEFTPKDETRQAKAFERLRVEGVNPEALSRWLAGNREMRDALRAIRREVEAEGVTRRWKQVAPLITGTGTIGPLAAALGCPSTVGVPNGTRIQLCSAPAG